MSYLRVIPLFFIMLLIYNLIIIVFGLQIDAHIFKLNLMSGESWGPTLGDILITLGIVALYIEIIKSTKSGIATIIDHTLSLFVFIAFLVEFIIMKGTATSTFVILMLMSFLDVLAGFTITVSSAQRDVTVSHNQY